MKKLAAAVAFAFALSAAGTAFAAGGGPKATGGAGFSQDDNPYHIGFNAMNHNKKKHKPDRGNVNLVDLAPTIGDVPDSSFTGHVTCYDQVGNKAWFSGTIDNPIPSGDPGTTADDLGFFLIAVQDNGKKKTSPRDLIRVQWDATPPVCTSHSLTADNQDQITSGNIQVHKTK